MYRVTPDLRHIAPVTIGLGPNFVVGENCDMAIETKPTRPGRLVKRGSSEKANHVPQRLGGLGKERFVHASREGLWHTAVDIGVRVFKDFVVGRLDGLPVRAPIDGLVRGIARDGSRSARRQGARNRPARPRRAMDRNRQSLEPNRQGRIKGGSRRRFGTDGEVELVDSRVNCRCPRSVFAIQSKSGSSQIEVRVMSEETCILVCGIGETASAVARRLFAEDRAVAIHQATPPRTLRRKMAFSDAWFDGAASLDGVEARRADLSSEFLLGLRARQLIPVLTQRFSDVVERWPWDVIVTARGEDDPPGEYLADLADLTIGLGGGFVAGKDCDIVIETQRNILERSFAPAALLRAAKANPTAISPTSTKCARRRPACSKPPKSSAPSSKAARRWGRSAKASSTLPFPARSEVSLAEGKRSRPHR